MVKWLFKKLTELSKSECLGAVEAMKTKKPLKLFRILDSLLRKLLQIYQITRMLINKINPSQMELLFH